MILFDGPIGRVVRLEEPGLQGSVGITQIDDAPIDFLSRKSIITRISVAQQVNAQFLHTFGNDVYIYVFGDRMGSIGLSGISFANDCVQQDIARFKHGSEQILDWYRANRLSERGDPVRVMLGNTAIEGFVTNLTLDVVDPITHLMQWGLTLMAFPD